MSADRFKYNYNPVLIPMSGKIHNKIKTFYHSTIISGRFYIYFSGIKQELPAHHANYLSNSLFFCGLKIMKLTIWKTTWKFLFLGFSFFCVENSWGKLYIYFNNCYLTMSDNQTDVGREFLNVSSCNLNCSRETKSVNDRE